jgi:CheY-like chemotaxis protein/anti-sigma regulatory factor (Ser/Thr protein kinase)
LIEEAIWTVRPLIEKHSVALAERCERGLAVLADEARLRQILEALLSNAAQYNRVGGRVVVEARALDEERVRIAVGDTGPGIAPERMPQLFKPFERLGAERGAIDGAGIGLALCARLAERMGAEMGVESTVGEGSTFSVTLPRAHDIPAQPAEPQLASAEGLRTLLYIEDNVSNVKLVQALFRRRPQLRVLAATGGEQGIELADRHRPDAILLDIKLPDIDGYTVLRRLRELPGTRDIPVLALTADAMPIDVERGLAAGFAHYLVKPVKVHALVEAVEQALAGAR